ncbi:hypothetical protein FXN63_06540 [Pigmentiphaga aceris]|uniref:ChaN family lipoprotein n=1 Tax=Pigmentiphaga aceris TaxID=1940612 RepID=A0A5C0AV02_9BURK|nr:DUF5682 family protein [Pigmentiphaga aceris]QEI05536.1 hypothetical protein FXN63_06540 [Pigmentiphaga aceris]
MHAASSTVSEHPGQSDDGLIVIGVRHHSPACARHVRQVIASTRPAFVLVEGPADFNPHIADLKRPHTLPVAIFSFHAGPNDSRSSYAPFCEYSPEWQALSAAFETGATPLFCDLPAWTRAFGDTPNRYADPHGLHIDAVETALASRLGEQDLDALWDALAEQADPDALPARLAQYFALLRPDGAEDPSEAAREQHMGRYAAWAVRQAAGRPVVLVCGGWHADAIRRIARSVDGAELPDTPQPDGDTRVDSYLVPYSYPRLDRLNGYAAGMPSPAYYEQVWQHGLARASDWAYTVITRTLRKRGQVVSTADRIAWAAQAEGLARLRGHRAALRHDLLDGALSTLLKDGLDQVPDWSSQRGLRAHPFLGTMLHALSGKREGQLAAGTREPPLLLEIQELLRQLTLEPQTMPREVQLDWSLPEDRRRAHVLHALRILGIPGFERVGGTPLADTRTPSENFRITRHRDLHGALIEASRWGGTLEAAASGCLAARDTDIASLANTLSDALFAGLMDAHDGTVKTLDAALSQAHDLGALGKAHRRIVSLYRFGDIFGADARAGLARLAQAGFEQTGWLLESPQATGDGKQAVTAMQACRDLLRDCPEIPLARDSFLATAARCITSTDSPPTLAGAALGLRIACGETAADGVDARIRRVSQPTELGDFLIGLFALARDEIGTDQGAMQAVEELVADWHDGDFLRALPPLREAFAWFPPRERERIARALLTRHGMAPAQAEADAMHWMRQSVPLDQQAYALAAEQRAVARMARAGLVLPPPRSTQ